MTRPRLRLVQLEDLDCPDALPVSTPTPDLVVSSFRVEGAASPGGAQLDVTVFNQDYSGAAAASQGAVYGTGTTGNDVQLLTFDVPPLDPRQSYTFQAKKVLSAHPSRAVADWQGAVAETDETNNEAAPQFYDTTPPPTVHYMTEVEPNDTLDPTQPTFPNTVVNGTLTTGDVDVFPLAAGTSYDGRAEPAAGSAVDPRLDLLDATGAVVQTSDDIRIGDRTAEIRTQLNAGEQYYVRVSAPNTGAYKLTSEVTTTTSLGQPISAVSQLQSAATSGNKSVLADITGDGIPDLVSRRLDAPLSDNYLQAYEFPTGVVEYRPGQGDGTFGDVRFSTSASTSLLFADMTGDGIPDQIDFGIVSSGPFTLPALYPVAGTRNEWVARVYRGLGDGTFASDPQVTPLGEQFLPANYPTYDGENPTGNYSAGYSFNGIQITDLDGDGHPDLLAVIDLLPENGYEFNRTTLVGFGSASGQFQEPSLTQGIEGDFEFTQQSFVRRRGNGGSDVVFVESVTLPFNIVSVGSVSRTADGRRVYSQAPLVYEGLGASVVVGNFDGAANGTPGASDEIIIPGEIPEDPTVIGDAPWGTVMGETNVAFTEGPDGRLVRDGTAPNLLANTAVTLRTPSGYDDILSVPELVVQHGLGGNDFTTDIAPSANHYNSGALLVGDLNGDGRDDYVYEYDTSNSIHNPLDGPAAENPFFAVVSSGNGVLIGESNPYPLPPTTFDVVTADINNDGIPDVLALTHGRPRSTDTSSRDVTFPIPSQVTIFFGGPDGNLSAGHSLLIPDVSDLTGVACADFNADGRTDMVVAADGQLIMYLGRGDGSFVRVSEQQSGDVPLATGDFNGDGHVDLVAGTTVYFGNGDGTFGSEDTLPLDAAPVSVLAQDLNRDGFDDIVYATPTTVGVVRGGAVLSPPVAIYSATDITDVTFLENDAFVFSLSNSGPPTALSLVVARGYVQPSFGSAASTTTFDELDFDNLDSLSATAHTVATIDNPGDGSFLGTNPDLISANLEFSGYGDFVWSTPASQYIITATGQDEFADPVALHLESGAEPIHFAATATNKIYLPTLITLNQVGSGFELSLSPTVFTTENSSNTKFQVAPQRLTEQLGRVRVADVTGDGLPDRVTFDGRGRIFVRVAKPDGTFDPPVMIEGDALAFDVVANTPNGPGIVVAASAGLMIFNRDPNGEFSPHTYPELDSNPNDALSDLGLTGVTQVVAADLNGDGQNDFIYTYPSYNLVLVDFSGPTGYQSMVLPTGLTPTDVHVADLDGNGVPDILCVDKDSSDVDVFLNPALGAQPTGYRFRATVNPTTSDASGVTGFDESTALAVGDFNGDGSPDVVVVNHNTRQAVFLMGTGNGTFTNPTSAVLGLGDDPGQAVTGDFNHDGHTDLAILMRGEGQVWVWRGDGKGGFGPVLKFDAGAEPTSLEVGDANGDVYPDLFVGNAYGDVLTLLNSGTGKFAPPAPPAEVPLAIADVNGDGTPDVLLANPATNQVRVWLRTPGSADFTPSYQDSRAVQDPGAVQFVDLNGDGAQDLVVLNTGGNAVSVYLGSTTSSSQFTFDGEFPVGVAPTGVTIADVDGDGTLDIVTANEGSNDVSVLLGHVTDGKWTSGPDLRLSSNGIGPTAVTVRFRDIGRADLYVFNRESSSLALLPAVGGGFFRDASAATLSLPPNLTTNPFLDFANGQGFVADGNGTVFGFDLNNFGAGFRSLFSVGAGQSIVSVAEVELRDGLVGLFAATASGLLTFAMPKGDAYITVLQEQLAAGQYSAALALRTDSGFDVYLTTRGSNQPEVMELGQISLTDGGVAVLPVPSFDSLSASARAARQVNFDTGDDPLAPVPAINLVAADDGEGQGELADFSPRQVSALITVLGANGPTGEDSEATRRWETWFLDLDRMLKEAVSPRQAREANPDPEGGGGAKPALPNAADPPKLPPADAAPKPNGLGAGFPADGNAPPPGGIEDMKRLEARPPKDEGEINSAAAEAYLPSGTAMLGVLWGVQLWTGRTKDSERDQRDDDLCFQLDLTRLE